jgi:hypothetical protein
LTFAKPKGAAVSAAARLAFIPILEDT